MQEEGGILPDDRIEQERARLEEFERKDEELRTVSKSNYAASVLIKDMLTNKYDEFIDDVDAHRRKWIEYETELTRIEAGDLKAYLEKLQQEATVIQNAQKFQKAYKDQEKSFEQFTDRVSFEALSEEDKKKFERIEDLLDPDENPQTQENLDEIKRLRQELIKSNKRN